MTANDLRAELRANNIEETSCLIFPTVPVEGALCLVKTSEGRYRVILNDRGDFMINETLQSEHDACRYFLKKALTNPVNRKDFKQADLFTWKAKIKELMEKYQFDEDSHEH